MTQAVSIESASVSLGLVLNVPDWFEQDDFLQWLNSENLMTNHRAKDEPGDCTEALVYVDPSLSGEGSEDGTMPDAYWSAIVEACRQHIGPKVGGNHFMVRLTNMAV